MTCAARAHVVAFVKVWTVSGLHKILTCLDYAMLGHTHAHTKSSNLWTNKPVLPKDRIWPLGGGTRHFLPTSALLLSPSMLCVCVCVMWLVLCFLLNTDPLCPTGSEGRGWAIKGQEGKQMRYKVCNNLVSNLVPSRVANVQVSFATKN